MRANKQHKNQISGSELPNHVVNELLFAIGEVVSTKSVKVIGEGGRRLENAVGLMCLVARVGEAPRDFCRPTLQVPVV